MDEKAYWTESVCTVGGGDSMRDAAKLMHKRNVGSLLVVDGGKPIGIVTERDLVGVIATGVEPGSVKVADAMTKNPIVVKSSEDLDAARELMLKHDVRHIPVVGDDGQLVGVVSLKDVIKGAEGKGKPTTIRFSTKLM
jgi:CBS domain-containing protein